MTTGVCFLPLLLFLSELSEKDNNGARVCITLAFPHVLTAACCSYITPSPCQASLMHVYTEETVDSLPTFCQYSQEP